MINNHHLANGLPQGLIEGGGGRDRSWEARRTRHDLTKLRPIADVGDAMQGLRPPVVPRDANTRGTIVQTTEQLSLLGERQAIGQELRPQEVRQSFVTVGQVGYVEARCFQAIGVANVLVVVERRVWVRRAGQGGEG